MAHVTLTVVGQPPPPEQTATLLRDLTAILVEVFGRSRELATASMVHTPPGSWALGGELLSDSTSGAWVAFHVVEGAAGDQRAKNEAIRRATELVWSTLGSGELPINVLIEELPPQNWGLNGRTVTQLPLPKRAH
jgi:phenylpyruvate tautomerase PptA (4-oxalocrotonate tautomerase family)